MPTPELSMFSQEWITIQNHYEQYEKNTLLIKLSAIALYFGSQVLTINAAITAVIIIILWVQESIFRTYQSRLGERIIRIESFLRQNGQLHASACQLHSEWLAGRKGLTGLLLEYAANAARPTVAFPYVVLLLVHGMAQVL